MHNALLRQRKKAPAARAASTTCTLSLHCYQQPFLLIRYTIINNQMVRLSSTAQCRQRKTTHSEVIRCNNYARPHAIRVPIRHLNSLDVIATTSLTTTSAVVYTANENALDIE